MHAPTTRTWLVAFAASAAALPNSAEVQARQAELASWPAIGGSLNGGVGLSQLIFNVFAPDNYVDGAPGFAAHCASASYFPSNQYETCSGFIDGGATVETAVDWDHNNIPPAGPDFSTISVRHNFTNSDGKLTVAVGTYTTTTKDVVQFHVSVSSIETAN